jgi:hypothetical protein
MLEAVGVTIGASAPVKRLRLPWSWGIRVLPVPVVVPVVVSWCRSWWS